MCIGEIMAFTSVSGTPCAERTLALAHGMKRRGPVRATVLAPVLMLLMANSPPLAGDGIVNAQFTGLRSQKGMVRACLTRNPEYFLHCDKDPASFKQSVAASPGAHLRFTGVPSGDYALTVLHDENGNSRADMMLGIPREGFGFSENPRIRFGPPKFEAARFHVGPGEVTKNIAIKYFF